MMTIQWEAVPPLQRSDADLSIYFLSAPGILFTQETNDLWFAAHREGVPITDRAGNSAPSYLMDEDASPLACTRQFQYCNPNLPSQKRCQPLRGWLDNSARLEEIAVNQAQLKRLNYLVSAQVGNNDEILSIVTQGGNSVLTARDNLGWGTQGPLPDNQWQLEIEHWVKGTMASLQRVFVETAKGPPTADLGTWFSLPPNGTEQESMCRSQKILSTAYSSFNVLGIIIILAIGGAFIILDLTLEFIIDFFLKRCSHKKRKDYAAMEWNATSVMQLQRLAHEELGLGTWASADKLNPVTCAGEKLAILDVRDEKHPVLKAPEEHKLDVPLVPLEGVTRINTDRTEQTLLGKEEGDKDNTEIREPNGLRG